MTAKKAVRRTLRTPKKEESLATPSDATKAAALKAFGSLGTVTAACVSARIARRTWYDWIEKDPAFGARVLEVAEDVTDELEAEAIRRAKAVNGSDTLLIFLLKSRRPQQYREKQEITVVSADVRGRVDRQVQLIASRSTWNTSELLAALSEVWG